jgi:transposase
MPAKYVRRYLKGQKNDFRDAEAIAEAVQRRRAAGSPSPLKRASLTLKHVDHADEMRIHRARDGVARRLPLAD